MRPPVHELLICNRYWASSKEFLSRHLLLSKWGFSNKSIEEALNLAEMFAIETCGCSTAKQAEACM